MRGNLLRLLNLALLCLAFLPLYSQPCDCLTTGNCPVPIQDNGTFQGTLDVTVNGPNDLGACPLTSVCFSITHTWVGDLAVTLTSPSGLNYMVMADAGNGFGQCGTQEDNIDICISIGTGNPVTNNTEYICNTGPCASGTCCLTGTWTMPCGGVTDPVTGAQQAPSCDLNDFNQAGDPANGTWTLTVNDICSQDVGTLNNFSLTFACGTLVCTVCEADGGSLNAPNLQACQGDPDLMLNLPPTYGGSPPNPGDYSYAYVIAQAGIITAVNPNPDMSGQPPGTYSVCGFSYAIAAASQLGTLVGQDLSDMQAAFSSTTAPFCGDFSTNCITVTIGPPIPPTQLDTAVCIAQCVEIGGVVLCSSGTVILESYLGCDSVINVNFIPIIIPPTDEMLTVCPGECVFINNQQLCPPGPHVINFESWQGCDSLVIYAMTEVPTFAIIQPASPPPLTCANPAVTLDGSSSVPASNVTYLWTGPFGTVGNQPIVTVDEPGIYTLAVTNNNVNPPCTATATVEVMGNLSGPNLQLNSPPPSICAGQFFDLATLSIVDQNGTNPTLTFHSASPATPANILPSTNVSPSTTTTYYVLGTSGNCTDELPVTLTVNAAPLASFNATSPICQGASSVVTYTGGAGGGATFAWNFGGGTATPGVGQGPHLVTWSTPGGGTYTVSLTVTQGGCTSQPVQHTVQVDAPLAQPSISCGTTTSTSVQFLWNDVPGATSYNVTVVTGQTGTQNGNSFTVNNLNPGTTVTIQVTAVGNGACGNSTASATCISQNCPPVTVNINPVADICLAAGSPTVDLEATISGGAGNGTGTWSGTGITNPSTGIFDPNVAGAGSHTITFSYMESACNYSATTTIDVFATPTSLFVATSPICENGTSMVTFTGSAGPGATFNWNFGGGTASPGTGAGPHTVTWASGGSKTITLLVQENGCPSATTSQTVQVDELLDAPVVNCVSTLNSVEFSWSPVSGANSYVVSVSTGQTGVMNSTTSYLVTGLATGETVTVVVQAVSGNACPGTSTPASCTAQDCPNVTVAIDPVADICLDGTTSPFFLNASQTGGAGGGTFTWSGPGLLNPASGLFDPEDANVGANAIVATYAEGTCSYNASLTINVFPQPTASFTTTSPICLTGASVVNYTGNASGSANFTWDFGGGTATPGTGAGPHSVTWASNGIQSITLMVEENGCASQTESQTVSVETPLQLPQITCSITTSSVEFFWNQVPGATDYNVNILTGSGGVATSDTSFLFSNLAAGTQITIQVEAVSTGPCGSSMTQANCTAQNCPNVTVSIAPVNGICLGGILLPFDLSATVSGGAGGGTLIWSGTGITDPAAGTFDPAAAGQGSHVITAAYEEGACQYSSTITINVFPPPVADFSVQSPVCQGENSVVQYTGTPQPGLTYTWDFDGGTATPGIGQGPHNVSWAATGSHVISLTVSAANGCASQPATQTVQVDQPLQPPVISCNPTTSSIEFTWADVPGATNYLATLISGNPGTQTSQNSYLIAGLVPGNQATIEVAVFGSTTCPFVSAQQTCIAMDCPDITVDIEPVEPICLGATVPTQLLLTINGSDGSGSGTWSGNGVSPSGGGGGMFDPVAAGVGQHLLTYTFVESGCTFNGSTVVTVNQTPTPDFTADAIICQADAAAVTYIGDATNNASFIWDFGGGMATPGTGVGPHTVTWASGGAKTISLTVVENGCTSALQTFDVQVDELLQAPTVTCNATTQSVEFSWQPVIGATNYNVAVIGGSPGSFTSQTAYLVDNLNPGQSVSIELTVSGSASGGCPPVVATSNCAALPCPNVTIDIEPIQPICLTELTTSQTLTATITGSTGGTTTWSGSGVTNPTTGIFDPSAAGLGTHTLTATYQIDNCSFSENIQVQVVAQPIADAGADATLTCKEGETEVQLGGSGTSTGTNLSYVWSAAGGAFPGDSLSLQPTVTQAGTYTLTVTNTQLGCSATDIVVVQASQEVPVAEISIQPVSCFGEDDAAISVDSVSGGQPPYLYSLNGSPFAGGSNFNNLEAGVYELTVLDGNGCENMVTIDIQQPQEVNVELILLIEGDNVIRLGDSLSLLAQVSIPEDSLDRVEWTPVLLLNCDTCLNPVAYPVTTTTFTVTVESNGCVDSDQQTVFVKKERLVFVPNAFSPNEDGTNDKLMVFAGSQVSRIKTFLVFDRWGETVWEYKDFAPNDPAGGWDGKYRGKPLDPAVFTWFAEVEFVDGRLELFEGDATLMK